MAEVRVLSLPCVDEKAAEECATWFRGAELDAISVDGRNVLIPTSYPPFAWDVAEIAVEREWASDPEVCAAVGAFLEGADVR